ncbi:TPA: hypothetical protein ACGJ7A_005754 [Pseudomonas aeruginosa]
MFIKLHWNNPNETIPLVTDVYRSASPFEENLAGADKVAELPKGVTEFIDQDTIVDYEYYYRLVFKNPGYNAAVSDLYKFKCARYNGLGPNELLFGNDDFGYLGRYPGSVLNYPKINNIRVMFGLSESEDASVINSSFHKFVINGKLKNIHSCPIASGGELPMDNTIIQTLLNGDAYSFNIGLHKWSMYLPKCMPGYVDDKPQAPGEMTAMLDAITEMYDSIKMDVINNTSGGKLSNNDGLNAFYKPLADRYPNEDINNIMTVDWEGINSTVIGWTPETTDGTIKPKEFNDKQVTFDTTEKWESTLIWPIFVYHGIDNN